MHLPNFCTNGCLADSTGTYALVEHLVLMSAEAAEGEREPGIGVFCDRPV